MTSGTHTLLLPSLLDAVNSEVDFKQGVLRSCCVPFRMVLS